MTPQLTRSEIVARTLDLVQAYAADNMDLTVRQVYYQLVSQGVLLNGQNHYKRVVDALGEARLEGDFPLDALVDRGREVRKSDVTQDDCDVRRALGRCRTALANLPYWYIQRGRWWGQPNLVSVWVEKDALAGVFEKPCKDLGVSWFPCKGYPSHSALWDWTRWAAYVLGQEPANAEAWDANADSWDNHGPSGAQQAVVLYFGDHDPDGWEIPRSAERTIRTMMDLEGLDFPVRFERVALNMNQIQQYSPPPFWAKPSSSRYKRYVQEHKTDEAWELDALEPRVLRDLIRARVNRYFSRSIAEDNQREVFAARQELIERMDGAWVRDALTADEEE